MCILYSRSSLRLTFRLPLHLGFVERHLSWTEWPTLIMYRPDCLCFVSLLSVVFSTVYIEVNSYFVTFLFINQQENWTWKKRKSEVLWLDRIELGNLNFVKYVYKTYKFYGFVLFQVRFSFYTMKCYWIVCPICILKNISWMIIIITVKSIIHLVGFHQNLTSQFNLSRLSRLS